MRVIIGFVNTVYIADRPGVNFIKRSASCFYASKKLLKSMVWGIRKAGSCHNNFVCKEFNKASGAARWGQSYKTFNTLGKIYKLVLKVNNIV